MRAACKPSMHRGRSQHILAFCHASLTTWTHFWVMRGACKPSVHWGRSQHILAFCHASLNNVDTLLGDAGSMQTLYALRSVSTHTRILSCILKQRGHTSGWCGQHAIPLCIDACCNTYSHFVMHPQTTWTHFWVMRVACKTLWASRPVAICSTCTLVPSLLFCLYLPLIYWIAHTSLYSSI